MEGERERRTVSNAGRTGHLVVVEAGVIIARDFCVGQFAIQLVAFLGSHRLLLRVEAGGRLVVAGRLFDGGSVVALRLGRIWVQPAKRRGTD